MANKGYADDDGSRDPGGAHGEGRGRVSMRDVCATTGPAVVAEMPRHGDRINNQTTSDGDAFLVPTMIPVDGDSNSSSKFVPAAYPSYTSSA